MPCQRNLTWLKTGEMVEWSKAPHWKCGVPQGIVRSSRILSASTRITEVIRVFLLSALLFDNADYILLYSEKEAICQSGVCKHPNMYYFHYYFFKFSLWNPIRYLTKQADWCIITEPSCFSGSPRYCYGQAGSLFTLQSLSGQMRKETSIQHYQN